MDGLGRQYLLLVFDWYLWPPVGTPFNFEPVPQSENIPFMPSFVCDHCQETLKKSKLDQHAQRCRQALFSCIDCHSNFKGTDYRTHFSCITEIQKYHQKQQNPPVTDTKKVEPKIMKPPIESELSAAIKKLVSDSPQMTLKVVKKQLKKSLGKMSKKTLQENIKFSLKNGELVIKLE